jgi:hypothetical protein
VVSVGRACCAPFLVAMAVVVTRPAFADPPPDSAAAQALFDDAKKLMGDGHFEEACPKLEASQRADPSPGTLFRLADCYEHVGRTASAWTAFLEVAGAAHASEHPQHEALARQRAAALEPKLSRLRIARPSRTPPGLRVLRDGAPLDDAALDSAIPIDPGKHSIAVSAPGKASWETRVDVAGDGGSALVRIPDLADVMPPPQAANGTPPARLPAASTTSARRTAGWIGMGAGLVGLGVGTAFGLMSLGKHDDAKDHCMENACDADGVELRHGAIVAGNVSTVAFAAGAAVFVVGGILWLSGAPASRGPASARAPWPMTW